MRILYLLTSPPPPLEGTDAVFQEVAHLHGVFGGEIANLFPLRRPSSRFPRSLYGLHKIRELRRLETGCAVNHVYFSVLHAFPVLGVLHNPIVYTVVASLDGRRRPSRLGRLRSLHRIVVSNERDANILSDWGLSNVAVVSPGLAGARQPPHRLLEMGNTVTLVMASAPWERQQFDSKGIDALLEAAVRLPYLRLILLWRGLFSEEIAERVRRLGIASRVEIVDRKVDIGDHLAAAHAAVLLPKRADVVKAFPHSLIEALLAGKPVLITQCVPMADYVRAHDCGIVLPDASVEQVCAAVEALRGRYAALAARAAALGPDAFSIGSMVEAYREIYAAAEAPQAHA